MERLTKRINGEACHYDCHGTCGTCDGCECFEIGAMVDKLAAYEDAEEHGRLVVLPCKIGSPIYILRGDVNNGWETAKKTHVEKVSGGFSIGMLNRDTMEMYDFYYLTREEAEAVLRKEQA